ncbi:zinc-dependent metalloprotease [Paucibacter sp. R3-3]|uniref:Zinc-dependent metalloprotease n=1 Tax=Roseateles agri TaxID=3098619 RepID=A0ABU5DBW0_9BURK|nr:zinc-dependent metalloprotease [Paucibacter sp. R3-3]MDY0743250.1 zinc-dependent metalloprotease [Paucibacter sp. R3-3]
MPELARLPSAVALLLLLGACAAPQNTGKPAAPAAPAAAVAASAPASAASAAVPGAVRPPEPGAPRPFAEVTRGAKVDEGLFPIWRNNEKAWIEIPKDMLDKPFMFSVNVSRSVGERGLYASQMTGGDVAEFHRIGNQIQLVALNTKYRATDDQGGRRAVEQGFSPSLLGSVPMAAAEHPERKSLLIDASFLFSDIPGYSTLLEYVYRLPFGPDRGNSYFESTRADPALSTLTARIHFATPRIPAPPLVMPPVPIPSPPQATPDPRSFFISYVYNFQKLTDEPMAPRLADPRVGLFSDSFFDLGNDQHINPRVHYINRWRLEKKEPEAALSEPVTPITYWLDKNIPAKYRASVEAGILEWNKAFEGIGFKNAIVVKQQPDDADWDDMDAAHASVRWLASSDVGFAAIGPHLSDPRSGEILDADISISEAMLRSGREFAHSEAPQAATTATTAFGELPAGDSKRMPTLSSLLGRNDPVCNYAQEAAGETAFALDVLEARGEIEPGSPEAEAFVQQMLKGVVMHEVGHTLGLMHNFKGSLLLTQAQLENKGYTEANGLSGSVMDYNALNIAAHGESQGSYHDTTLGPYDYWAIEYAYKTLPKETEAADLAKIAKRGETEPGLAYADDIDAGVGGYYDGMDPMVNRFDLGNDPLAFFKRRLQLSRELWTRVQAKPPVPGEDPLRRRRAIVDGFFQLFRTVDVAGKYVGGMYTQRDLPGAGGRPNFKPVENARQREALQAIDAGLFRSDSFRFKPEFLSTLTVDYREFNRGGPLNIAGLLLAVQTAAMDRLMSPLTAMRLLDMPNYVPPAQRKSLVSLSEVYDTMQRSIWSELKTGGDIDRLRRNLQREHLRRLQILLVKSPGVFPPDALSLTRLYATRLEGELRAALARGGYSVETRAHLAESLTGLSEALRATVVKG